MGGTCIIWTILHTNESIMSQIILRLLSFKTYPNICMASKENLEKRIENLEKEVQHLKAALQHQTKNKKKSFGSWLKLN